MESRNSLLENKNCYSNHIFAGREKGKNYIGKSGKKQEERMRGFGGGLLEGIFQWGWTVKLDVSFWRGMPRKGKLAQRCVSVIRRGNVALSHKVLSVGIAIQIICHF